MAQCFFLVFKQTVGRLMSEVKSRRIMRARVFWVLSILLLCAWSSTPIALDEEPTEAASVSNQQQNWNQPNRPVWQSGWSPQIWQPQPTGMLWEIDFSPNGQMIAAVDISTNLAIGLESTIVAASANRDAMGS